MSTKQFEPESAQIISDLGQLKAFTHPVQARLLRILQKREATPAELAAFIDEPPESVALHLDALRQAGLIKELGHRNGEADKETVYRAGARYYGFRPDPADLELVAGPVTMALLGAVGQELVASMDEWPTQRMIGQLRRARLSPSRLLEFEERFEELVDEFWGSPDQPAVERDDDPVMSLASVVYRYPDQD
mgnify:CR=1 FL=1